MTNETFKNVMETIIKELNYMIDVTIVLHILKEVKNG